MGHCGGALQYRCPAYQCNRPLARVVWCSNRGAGGDRKPFGPRPRHLKSVFQYYVICGVHPNLGVVFNHGGVPVAAAGGGLGLGNI